MCRPKLPRSPLAPATPRGQGRTSATRTLQARTAITGAITGQQRDDDVDGLGNACDGKFSGNPGARVNGHDVADMQASLGHDRTDVDCGVDGDLACAPFDVDERGSTIDIGDWQHFQELVGLEPGPSCSDCPMVCDGGETIACPD